MARADVHVLEAGALQGDPAQDGPLEAQRFERGAGEAQGVAVAAVEV